MVRNPILMWLLPFVIAFPLGGRDRVLVNDGNVFLENADGSRFQVTTSGRDSQPDLAIDGSKIVFVRKMSERSSELWIVESAKGGTGARPLVNTPLEVNGRQFSHVFAPAFSGDSQTVYFMIQFAGTTNGIMRIDPGASKPTFIVAAIDFRVVLTGQYKGNLVARIRKAKLAPGYYEWYWLVTPEGRELGVVGQDERDVAEFLNEQGVPGN